VSGMTSARFAWSVLRGRPFSLLVQVTNRCNLACPFCDFWPNPDLRGELTTAELARVARELPGPTLVSIEGGEPMVRPDLTEIVAGFADAGHLPLLYTNGWFIDAARAQTLLRAHQVGVSIDFPDAARHDAMRRGAGAWARAVAAVEHLRDTLGPTRVHVMTVLMKENEGDLDALLSLSARLGVLHQVTLISDQGFRRGAEGSRPTAAAMAALPELARRWTHFRAFRSYLEGVPRFLEGGELPRCRAGHQSFNLDHVGNVAACIETIDRPVGNVREASIPTLLARLADADRGAGCQACWTLCRGMSQALGQGGSPRAWSDLARM
jgi:MoaA/NifB/PqqE/SkfB family radical SAM enzyme